MIYPLFRYPKNKLFLFIFGQGFGILFRSAKLLMLLTLNLISALLRDLQKMAASKPIPWLYMRITSSLSLNNNFGTLNSCSGLFPFRHTTLAHYVRLFKMYLSPSESKSSPIKFSQFPDIFKMSKITILYLLWCYLNYLLK